MHSRLIVDGQRFILYYLESLSCFMTSAIEIKVRKMLGSLNYTTEALEIRPALVKDFPQQLLDRQSNQKRQLCSDLFDRTLVGEHVNNEKQLWVELSFNPTGT